MRDMTAVIDIFDTTTVNVPSLPVNQQAAGYTTGSADIKWTPAQFAAHTTPFSAVRIDQDSGASDPTADILDVENGAATVVEIPHWLTLARESFNNGHRLGQRWPGIYCNLGTLDSAINVCILNGLSNVPFAIADLTNRADAAAKVSAATGPFPRVWQQYQFGTQFDSGMVSVDWLKKVSTVMPPAPTIQSPPGQWNDPKSWSWQCVVITGLGMNGEVYQFTFNPKTGNWTGPVKLPKLCSPTA
jgi:hypothetical protein